MILLLGERQDPHLMWLAAALQRRGEPTELVFGEDLLGSRLSYRIDGAGLSSTLRLSDGRGIGHDAARLVVNRLTDVPPISSTASTADAAYLREEWRAALSAWLRTLPCPVLNPPRAASLAGPDIAEPAWLALAKAHGLAARAWVSDGSPEVGDPIDILCVGGSCLDADGVVPQTVQGGLRRMALFVGAPLLGARFDRDREWLFVTASILPPLSAAGEPLVDAIVGLAGCGMKPI